MRESKQIREDVLALAQKLGLAPNQILRWKIDRPMSEDARQVLANRAKRVHAPHDQPIYAGRSTLLPEAEIVIQNDSITFRFGRKKAPEPAIESIIARQAGGGK